MSLTLINGLVLVCLCLHETMAICETDVNSHLKKKKKKLCRYVSNKL